MKHCCHLTFKRAFEQMLFLLYQAPEIDREGMIRTLKYAISELDKTKAITGKK